MIAALLCEGLGALGETFLFDAFFIIRIFNTDLYSRFDFFVLGVCLLSFIFDRVHQL
jgi:hypothetical protein